MRGMITASHRFVKDDSGTTMLEYVLMVALVAAVCIAGVTLLGTALSSRFNTVAGKV